MVTVNEAINKISKSLGKTGKTALFTAFFAGLLTHMSALVSDFPNHDGLASMYFDQNMITSGRWFLGAACAITSYFSLPWLIGLISLIYIAIACTVTVKILKIEDPVYAFLISLIIAVFPSLASNFAYVFTMDGYMFGMLLCVLAVRMVTVNKKFGWLIGAGLLAFGMGCYQSYICITMVLCLYLVAEILLGDDSVKEKALSILRYFGMGAFGVALYYVLLRVLLIIQGKELDTYQGINEMSETNGMGLFATVKYMYSDFVKFSLSNVVLPNAVAIAGIVLLILLFLWCFIKTALSKKLFKKPLFYVFVLIYMIAVPFVMNAILLITTKVTYHVLMRYQWAFAIVILVAFIARYATEAKTESKEKPLMGWMLALSVVLVAITYIVVDNIAYSNLQKKYEKTYAYCLRLADRIEETEGYYQGIPIAMVGVVGEDSFPITDITADVTGGLLGINKDYLLYKPENFKDFYKYYLGITFNILGEDEVIKFYNEDFYAEMESFPGATSVKLHDGVIYVKTENIR